MARQNQIILVVVIVAGLAFFLTREKQSPVSSNGDALSSRTTNAAYSENESLNEEQLQSSLNPREKMQQTEISSHGEERAFQRRQPSQRHDSMDRQRVKASNTDLRSSALLQSTPWKVWAGVSALPSSSSNAEGALTSIAGFNLYQDDSFQSSENSFSTQAPMVVYDQRLGSAGVVTGTIEIQLRQDVSVQGVAQHYGLKVLNSLEGSRIHFVTSQVEPFDLQGLQQALKAEPSIERVELEVLSRQYDKN